MITSEEIYQTRARILSKSIEYYCLLRAKPVFNKRGKLLYKKITRKQFSMVCGVSVPTIVSWTKTGRILRKYERKLVKMKVLDRLLP